MASESKGWKVYVEGFEPHGDSRVWRPVKMIRIWARDRAHAEDEATRVLVGEGDWERMVIKRVEEE